ncbi:MULTISPECIES: tripartite tricarboxylate transporter substrate binding protein [Comamonadaceae]|uniref:Bug family tripartite tricarboxylate transporter substrate binding protein n=1 Tax=unclassified Acidovorax TaxID=2684926 RepID=UPI0023DE3285|nr:MULTISPECIES: tripartite tricarboxylate transporter substrate binding protein [Comamonadaceae]WOI47366.1 tripartite tricarboxylate transporter substrate binding protein [Paracidovorax avenae]GKS86223.1 tripartite tricarboxylate transporter substrate binding protein [Acidovorax sp. SUPP1855]GKS95849.1 tripartite tricarboxylate transporter substrate binding protein [Acidovorax sp. SUPP2825]GKT01220.1 tripartite tricarboxylate transporter substrate binding protein [Acidovorax sp. SUPP3434]
MKRFLAAISLGILALGAQAQAWPEKPVTLVVPFPPGGSTDQVARAVGPRLTEKFKQSFLVDNKPGATGTIGATFVQRAAPDGYTFLVTSLGPLVIVPHLLKGLQYDALHGFDLITVAVQSPNVLVVPANSPHKTVADVIAYEKANPGKMSFASAGNGSSDHLTAELFWQQTGTKGVHIPYKGGAPAHTDLIGGQVDASFQNINAVSQYIKAGKMRALAITSAKRSPVLPDVPTLAEAGVPNVEVASWQAIVAPKGLPPAVREKAHAAFVEALKDPKVREQFTSIGFEMVTNTPEQFAAFQQQEFARWKKVIETGKISID